MLLTEQEIESLRHELHIAISVSDFQAIESAVIEKLKAQGPDMLYHGRCVVDCGEYGYPNVELLKLIPVGTKLYRLPEGD